ncbi:hypothetical protein ACVWZR_004249 [Bradyrhizobium sp. i1.3.1]
MMRATVGFCAAALHLVTERRAVEKARQAEDGKNGEDEDADALQRDGMSENGDITGRHDRWEGRGLRAEELLHGLLDADRERHRRDRQRQHAMAHHRIDQQHLEGEAQQEHREQDAEDDRKPERRAGMHRRQHQERRQHHELALREIDGLRGLPQQREADRDQRIDRASG